MQMTVLKGGSRQVETPKPRGLQLGGDGDRS